MRSHHCIPKCWFSVYSLQQEQNFWVSGGTGRRASLRDLSPKGGVGSNPISPTKSDTAHPHKQMSVCYGQVAELVDAAVSEAAARKGVRVRVPLCPQTHAAVKSSGEWRNWQTR